MPEKLKDILFPLEKVKLFADILTEVYPGFNSTGFVNTVCDEKWGQRELKEKMRHTTLSLHQFLPKDFPKTVEILKALVPKVTGFEAIVLPDYIEVYGMGYWDISLPALGELTKCGSSEFAVRPFLNKDLEGAMKFMDRWADDKDFKVRRFASEGCRPRLPWGMGVPALKNDPALILPVLEKLKNDPEEFVRKSVANNLNDISKDHPNLVLDICERWQGNSKETDWIVKHACRTLLKQGNKRAMLLFGFANPDKMQIENLKFTNLTPKIGDEIYFSFDFKLETENKQKVRMEYIIHFVKSSGKTSPKVFQMKEVEMKPGIYPVSKKHSFKNLSTRKHFVGEHKFEIVVNGEVKADATIQLI
ncbi:MAG: DNA alkylation repair protein [Prolixibacteraceae bacterium]|jgi:3-methyladenine DNA glycosylase AlkC|nr:DNA alkylation repair protein [Prolixibacteraceae bacterium]MBT6005662.1 DNA alkylation repair protein [Prolixibacteraceae bacterium]MBT6763924.1 DNA alkylation repair protein [Prolixibacteraceae bacterium]MBT6999944.1 DNA alkylation repair protein [Prolixibacteraceae bacterium]MBT7394143.1 DNA alkylation repair protein [Prolixibacteraceae bacterium]